MTPTANDLKKRLAQLKREIPTRGFERHPTVVETVSDLPTELQSPAVTALAAGEAIWPIIAFPPQIHSGWRYVPKQALLFTSIGVIHLLASIWPDQEPRITHLQGCGLLYMKVTLLLLYGFLEIVAQGGDAPTRLDVEFNTVAWYCLSRPLRRLLLAAAPRNVAGGPSPDAPKGNATAQLALEGLPRKFSNGVKIYGLLPGEELEALVFQPGVWVSWLLLFRRPVLANTLLMLTTNYLVVIQEELEIAQGWIFSYIPRSSIAGMQNRPAELGNELTVQLQRGGQSADYKLRLQSEAVAAWRGQWIQHGGQWEDLD